MASREVFLSWCSVFYLVRTFLSFYLFSLSFSLDLSLLLFVLLGPLSSSFSSLDLSLLLSPLPFSFFRGLVLFIEALVLFPKNEREGRQQLAILKGNI